jgi:hypothetical protein
MISLSTSAPPFLGRERLHRERVYVFAHALAERFVDELMLTHFREPSEKRAHDHRFEMATITGHFDVIALKAFFDALLDEIGRHVNPNV